MYRAQRHHIRALREAAVCESFYVVYLAIDSRHHTIRMSTHQGFQDRCLALLFTRQALHR